MPDHPVPAMTRTLLWLAAIGLVLLPVAGLGVRFSLWSVKPGLLLLLIAVVVNSLVWLTSLAGLIRTKSMARKRSLISTLLLASPAVILLVMGVIGLFRYPTIHHVSTDTVTPPAFVAAPGQRGDNSNPLVYTPELAAIQRQAYPDLVSIVTALDASTAFRHALETAGKLGWDVYAEVPAEGRIEAVDTTFWFGFKDDIVIRVEPLEEGGSKVDLRSVSRIGGGDVGANAKRIRAFRSHFQR